MINVHHLQQNYEALETFYEEAITLVGCEGVLRQRKT
jgi:hypothetical protein